MIQLKISAFLIAIILGLSSCKSRIHFVQLSNNSGPIEVGNSKADTSIQALIRPYKQSIGDEMNTIIGTVAQDLIKAKPESTMTNWLADLCFDQGEAYTSMKLDFAVLNYGGLRIPSIPAGPLKKGKVFELMPFENFLVVVEMTGAELKDLFNHIATKRGWPISKEVKLVIQGNKAVDVRIKGKKVQMDQKYRFATIDYIANGGDNCAFLKDKKQWATGVLFRDAIIQHVESGSQNGQSVVAKIEERVFILK